MNAAQPSRKRRFLLSGILAGLLILVLAALLPGRGKGSGEAAQELYQTARRGPLIISLNESGEIKPSQQIILKSEVEGRVSILYIIPEGTVVNKGDLLVELDASDKQDQLITQEIAVENAESDYILKKEDLEIARNQAASDIELAELEFEFAKEDLIKYKEGEYPNKLSEAKGNIALAEQELEQAKEKYEWSKKLFEEDFLSESELKSDELSWRHSELSLETSRGNLYLLENYTHKRELAELESDVRQKEAALERTRRKARSSIIQAESSLRAKESEFNSQKQKLEKIKDQIEKAKIYAPMHGQVIYSTSAGRRWDNNEPLAEGVEVWQRRDLIYLPTADTFMATANIHESYLKSMVTGMPVQVKCDALPGRTFHGRLTKISPMADTSRRWLNPDLKEYPVEILLNGGVGELKSGMSCRVEIIIERFEDAVSVPVQCVVRIGKGSYVWVRGADGKPERREVRVGLDNNIEVHIKEGLEGGEEVLLTPPLTESIRFKQQEPEEEENPQQRHGPPAGMPPAPGAQSGTMPPPVAAAPKPAETAPAAPAAPATVASAGD